MPEVISNYFQIQSRYLRSAHIERDFADPAALRGYVLTPHTQESLERLAAGLNPASGQRAWRITGDYGTGKSSFALVLAHLLAGSNSSLPPHIRHAVNFRKFEVPKPRLIPVLVTGAREPLAVALLRSLRRSLIDSCGRGRPPAVIEEIQSEIRAGMGGSISDDTVMALLRKAADHIISTGKGTGLLIILDELGKLLEFAALHPDRQDVFLLQNLAEVASRSGKKPFFIVGLLHQGFDAYADHLSESAQKEWEKVSGRFEELVFSLPLEQTALLVADALKVRTRDLPKGIKSQAQQDMAGALDSGWYGSAFARKAMLASAEGLYPLHPTALPVLVRLFSRFGQNERSLFSFLLSNEPFGLQAFAEQDVAHGRFYRIHNLYDYARATFGLRLNTQSYRSHWSLIDSMISSFNASDELDLQILKTVGLLNMLDSNDMLASDETISLSIAGRDSSQQAPVRAAVKRLQKGKSILYHRGAAGGYCLWPHTSVNLDKAYEDARRAVGALPPRISPLITTYLATRPMVARRHYIETGNLRHFEVRYSPVSDLSAKLKLSYESADGLILVALCDTEEERRAALRFAERPELRNKPDVLLAVPKPLNALAQLVQEFQRWNWVMANTPELNSDGFARNEVSRRLSSAKRAMEKRIYHFIGLQQYTGRAELQWFRQGKALEIESGRSLLAMLSDICDEVYPMAPRVLNELVNRRTLSSAAAAARMRLIERMFTSSSEALLGMNPDKKPPEMSIYLSVLKASGLHQEQQSNWALLEPKVGLDPCLLLPALNRIRQLLEEKMDTRVNISELLAQLRLPPYGVRDGLLPILLSAFAVINEQHVAFYYQGSFMRELGGLDLLHLTKVPDAFQIQYCKIAGVRSDLFKKLLKVLELKSAHKEKVDVLDVVRPLCVFAAQLPPFTHKTRRLSQRAIAVRDALLNAREPANLIFRDLPVACGLTPFPPEDNGGGKKTQPFVRILKRALDELQMVYPELRERMKDALLASFDMTAELSEVRAALAPRAERVSIVVSEPRLKSFCARLMDRKLPDAEWLESLGSLLCSMPPSKWTDANWDKYDQELSSLSARFRRIESITFRTGKVASDETAMRVTITRVDGTEVDNVIFISGDEESRIAEVEAKISSLLEQTKGVGLAATARAFWNALARKEVI